jgi:glycerol-3-phosphate dehydrogenase
MPTVGPDGHYEEGFVAERVAERDWLRDIAQQLANSLRMHLGVDLRELG